MSKKNQSNTAPTTGERAFNPIRVGDGKEAAAWVKIGRHTISVDGRIGKGELRLPQLLKSASGRKALVEIAKVDRECNSAVRGALGKEVSAKLGIDKQVNPNPLLTLGMDNTPSPRQEAITALAKLIAVADPKQVLSVQPLANQLIGRPVEVKTFTVLELLTLAEEKEMTVEQVLESIIAELGDSRGKGDFDGDQICAVELDNPVNALANLPALETERVGKGTELFERTRELLGKQYDKVGIIGQIKVPSDSNPLLDLKDLHLATPEMSGYLSSPESGRVGRSMGGHRPVGRILTGFETELGGDEPRLPAMDYATARNALVNTLFDGGGVGITSFSSALTMNPEFAKALKFGLFSASMKRSIGYGARARFNKAGKHFDKKARKAGKKIKITK